MEDKIRQAYVEGRDAFYNGTQIKDNPYIAALNRDLHSAWCRGFVEAEVESYTYA
jgi:hypothetical protein